MTSALDRLIALLPPPSHRRCYDWEATETRLGHRLPSDYKRFVDSYGPVKISDYLYVLAPTIEDYPNDLFERGAESLKTITDVTPANPPPIDLDENRDRFQAWGVNDDAAVFLWHKVDQNPDKWTTVVVTSDLNDWDLYDFGMTDYLYQLVSGRIEPNSNVFDLPADVPPFFDANNPYYTTPENPHPPDQ